MKSVVSPSRFSAMENTGNLSVRLIQRMMGECLELLAELSDHCSSFDNQEAGGAVAMNVALEKMTAAAIHALLAEHLVHCLGWLVCRSAALCGELPADSGEEHARQLMALEAASFAFGPLSHRLIVLEIQIQGLADRVRSLIQQDAARRCCS